MNKQTFKSLLKPEMGTNNVDDVDHAARILADAYELSTVGSSITFYGSTLVRGDRSTLEKFIKVAFEVNKATNSTSGYIVMAVGFCSYWIGSTFTPLPPMPPAISSTVGTKVLFPGNPTKLEENLKIAFSQTEFDLFVDMLFSALCSFHSTLAGTFQGLVPAAPSPIPITLPWVSILCVPPKSEGTSGTAGTSGTSGTAGTSGTSGTTGTSGTSGTTGTSGTSGTTGTSGTAGTSGTSGTSGTAGTSGTSGTAGTTKKRKRRKRRKN